MSHDEFKTALRFDVTVALIALLLLAAVTFA